MSKEANSVSRLRRWVGAALAIALLAIILPVLQFVLGFTGPSQDPPGGDGLLQESSGNVSIRSNRLVELASPVDDNDAANKAYVDAQASGGSSIVTLFGVSAVAPTGNQVRPGGSVPNCLRGIGPGSCASGPAAPVAAGAGTPACSTLGADWVELTPGFGPMNTLFTWYSSGGSDPDETDVPSAIAIGTDSICSSAPYALMRDINSIFTTSQVNNTASLITACTATQCNTCRICTK
ncbi:MAG: hypothetical protein Q8P45_02525 [Candidatus Harrisonbacteria bacterium]|nr:hypothetical protein [Candidatus Harrisonbacteria bacterium]